MKSTKKRILALFENLLIRTPLQGEENYIPHVANNYSRNRLLVSVQLSAAALLVFRQIAAQIARTIFNTPVRRFIALFGPTVLTSVQHLTAS